MPYEPVVRRLATTFTEMEVQEQYLSRAHNEDGRCRRDLGALLEIIREDLNNYNECMIPIDNSNTINMKLFPTQADPPPVKSWHVPIAKINFQDIVDDRWDLTMRKVIPCIDGISDVRRIALKADVSLELTKLALQHLLYYKTIMLLDMFFWSNVYALTPVIRNFILNDEGMQDECAAYVFTNRPRDAGYYLCRLFGSFCQGRTLKEWMKLHHDGGLEIMDGLDVRRLVQFGVIKSILRRVHKIPISSQYLAGLATGEHGEHSMRREEEEENSLWKCTDGLHHFDQIITELNMSEPEIMRGLSQLPGRDAQILFR